MLTDPRLRLVIGTKLADHGQSVLAALDGVRVVLRLRGVSPSASAGVGLLVGLVARLFAHVEIDGDAPADTSGISTSACDLLERLAWLRPPAVTEPTVDKVISVGLTNGRPVDLGIGGSVWTALVGREGQPVADERGAPLLGVQVAVCLAVAELIKDVLTPVKFVARRLDHSLVWDLLTYRVGDAVGPVKSMNQVPVAVAGVGSVGTSLVSALLSAETPFVSSTVWIDPEIFDDRNPFRYPALVDNVIGIGKAQWAQQLLSRTGTNAYAHCGDIAQWTSSRPEPGFDGVLVASPDTLDGRRDVADVLARTTVSIGVTGLGFHVARHHLGDGLACPYCEYVDMAPISTQAEVYAMHTGIEVTRVLQLMQPGVVLTVADLAVSQAAGKVPAETAANLVGHRLDDLVVRAYAEIGVTQIAGGADDPGQVFLAAPYVSALAGVLTAVEIYKISLGLPGVDRRLDVDLTGLPQGYVRQPAADTTGRCLCASPFRRRAVERLYPAPGTPSAGRISSRSTR